MYSTGQLAVATVQIKPLFADTLNRILVALLMQPQI